MIKNTKLSKEFDTNDFLETHYGKKPIAVSLKQYQKVKLDSYHNVIEEFNDFVKKGGSIASKDEISSSEEIRQRKKSLQENIKEYYLPIEKDKAIPYPQN